MSDEKEYLPDDDIGDGTIAATKVMDRLKERLTGTDSMADKLQEMRAASSAVATVAKKSDNPLGVIQAARNCASEVAEHGRTKKDIILDALESATDDVLERAAEVGLQLDQGVGVDEYLENELLIVKKVTSTDNNDEPTFRWEFRDGTAVETTEGTYLEPYNFWKKLATATDKQLQFEFVSEQIEKDESTDEYARLSIGPDDRAWHQDNWIRCLNSLVSERSETVTVTGPRTEVWDTIRNDIARSRAVRDTTQAVENGWLTVMENGDGVEEIWVPSKIVSNHSEDHGLTTKSIQQELAARGVDSDELGGERISEEVQSGNHTIRYWRLDAAHEEVPLPNEITDEVTSSVDSIDSVEWGDLDE